MGVTSVVPVPENNLGFMDILPIQSLTIKVCPSFHPVKPYFIHLFSIPAHENPVLFLPAVSHLGKNAYPDSKPALP